MKTEIKNICIADFDEEETTVSVTATDENGNEETFHIQTVDGVYRSDLGCWIFTNECGNDINNDDYELFDIKEIISQAETYIQSLIEEESTNYKIDNEWVYLLVSSDKVKIVTRNNNYINKDTSSYQHEFSDVIETFDTRNEAIEYLESL